MAWIGTCVAVRHASGRTGKGRRGFGPSWRGGRWEDGSRDERMEMGWHFVLQLEPILARGGLVAGMDGWKDEEAVTTLLSQMR
jgi:hypothetical protein